jgi:hypothetical protein
MTPGFVLLHPVDGRGAPELFAVSSILRVRPEQHTGAGADLLTADSGYPAGTVWQTVSENVTQVRDAIESATRDAPLGRIAARLDRLPELLGGLAEALGGELAHALARRDPVADGLTGKTRAELAAEAATAAAARK